MKRKMVEQVTCKSYVELSDASIVDEDELLETIEAAKAAIELAKRVLA